MFCRKCGAELPDESLFCNKCGEKVIDQIEEPCSNKNETTETNFDENSNTRDIDINTDTNNENASTLNAGISEESMSSKKPLLIITILFVIAIAIGIGVAIYSASTCSLSSCNNPRTSGSDYCVEHTCKYPDCTFCAGSDDYCYIHTCKYALCDNRVCEGSEYCSTHKCERDGCNNQKVIGSDYCSSHQIDMRTRLKVNTFSFSLNSAGGIRLHFEAENISGKEIKYINFPIYMYNSVGDSIKSDFGESKIDVEIVGVIKPNSNAKINGDVIGYCERATKILVNNVTVTYMDGTRETGHLGYYNGY